MISFDTSFGTSSRIQSSTASRHRPIGKWLAILLLLAIWLPSHGQVTSGTITGTAYDASGAAIPNATVTATSTATGAIRTVQTNALGYYTMPSLPPNQYVLSATTAGFAPQSTKITISLNEISTFDFHLSVGSSSQEVQVTSSDSALELQKDSHEISSLVNAQSIENLPADGRDVFQTLASAPNVNLFHGSGDNIGYFNLQADSLSIGGTTYGTTSYLQDGVNNFNLVAKTANLQPSIESVQEVSLIQNGAAARYDQPSVVNVITKGGTNTFHGRLYDYLRNDDLNANGYFATPKTPLRYNQFGGNVSGPIFKNKLFFLFDYSGLRYNLSQTVRANVPTAAERMGDFSADTFTIYDPSTYNATTGTISAFPSNKINPASISNFANLILAYYPLPTGSSVANQNYQKTGSSVTTYDSYLGRLDYNIREKDSVYGAYETSNPVSITPSFSPSPIFNSDTLQNAANAYVQETHTFGSSLLNVVRFGYNYSNISQTPQGAGATDYITPYALMNLAPDPSQWMPPTVNLSTHASEGAPNNPNGAIQHLYEFADEMDWTVGRHNINIGGELDKLDIFRFSADWNNGSYSFAGQYTSNHNATKSTGGSDIADLLLGFPTTAQGGTGKTTGLFHQYNVQPYIQDDWKISSRLVLNLGLRYDYYGSPASDDSSVYDVPTNTTYNGTYRQNYLDFAPRVGAAYSIDKSTVVHAGYGIYYTPFEYQELTFLLVHAPNFALQTNSYGLNNPTFVTNTFVANPSSSSQAPFTLALNMPTPYVQQWNLAVQRTLGSNWLLSLSYLGNKFTHQQIRHNPNQANLPSSPTDTSSIQSRRPYSYIGDVYEAADIGYANYHGMEVDLNRHFSHGFSIMTNYVWSKALDVQSSGINPPENGRNISADYGPSDFNVAHFFKFSSVYQLPLGPGGRFLRNDNWINREVLKGWQVSEIFKIHSGFPFSVTATDLSSTGLYHAQRANQVCDGNAGAPRSIAKWFNTACFVKPSAGQLGNEAKNNLRGPRTSDLDLTLSKDISLWKEKSLQFRVDSFDVLNHPLLDTPTVSIAAATFGQITSISGARALQLSLKLIY